MQPHPQTLAARHQALDRTIAREQARSGSDDATLARLKKEKLALKEALARAGD